MKYLQLRWTDEEHWHTIDEVLPGSDEEEILKKREEMQKEIDERYPQHTFTAEFRIIGS